MPILPSEFLSRAKEIFGDEYNEFIQSLDSVPPVSIRMNPFKHCNVFQNEENIFWSEKGRYLKERPSFTLDPYFHAGCYYVQDASSQFLEIAFMLAKKMLNRPSRILDLCAAPGGKSTHILSMISEEDLLVSNEIIPSRNNILRQNIIKWGCANAIVTQNNPDQLSVMKNMFDIIVVDAPCSGEGLFRKDPDAVNEWSLENVNRCSTRQKEILSNVYSMLKSDGILVYSTCTFEKQENDEQVIRLMDEFGMENIHIDSNFPGIVKTSSGLAFYPHKVKGEGFYISLLRKKSDEIDAGTKQQKHRTEQLHSYLSVLKNPESFTVISKEEKLFAIPTIHLNDFNFISKNSYVRLAGIYIGEVKGKDFIPSEAVALSNYISDQYPVVNLSKEDAIEFLKGGSPVIDSPNGFVLMQYENFNLGWVKKIGNRMNNYYPKEWRIRKK